MTHPDAVIQELWRVRQRAYEQAGGDWGRFVEQVRAHGQRMQQERGQALREDAPRATPSSGLSSPLVKRSS